MVALLVALGTGCHKDPAATNPGPGRSATLRDCATSIRFRDVTLERGVEFTYRNDEEQGRFAIIESMGGGVGLLDYDRDGWLDICVTGGGRFEGPSRLTGRPTGLFRSRDSAAKFELVAAAARIEDSRCYSYGVTVGDFDHDGFPDVLMTGYDGLQCFHNLGDGTFRETASAAGLTETAWGVSAAWGDLNGDQNLDLYVAHYVDWSFENDPNCPGPSPLGRDVCPPRRFEPLPHSVYFSNGDGTFREASTDAGLRTDGKGLGVALVDFDLDGDLDIYVANDTDPNFLYLNDGQGRFSDASIASGGALNDRGLPDGSMGIGVGDYNNDGLPDLLVTNYEGESTGLYRNLGEGSFLHASHLQGITAAGKMFVGWGVQFFDADADGDDDVLIANGHAIRFPPGAGLSQLPIVFENRDGRMVNVAPCLGGYFEQLHRGRGLAAGDLDRDGRWDGVISHVNEPIVVLHNETHPVQRSIAVRLIGRSSPRDGVGAIVEFRAGQTVRKRQIFGGASYASSSDTQLMFAMPKETRGVELVVRWPSGREQTVAISEEQSSITIVEPE
jgi:hypothetical protein